MTELVGPAEALGRLFEYPGPDYREKIAACRAALERFRPEAAERVAQFEEAVSGFSLEELQELFTRTFDLNPVCSLEVGWQLYGEEYARGSFLVAMRRRLRDCGVPEKGELPDHLIHVLPLLEHMESGEAALFCAEFLGPAVRKMLASIEGKGNPYEAVMRSVQVLVEAWRSGSLAEVAHG